MIAFSRLSALCSSSATLLILAGCAAQPEAPVVSLDQLEAPAQSAATSGVKPGAAEVSPNDRLRPCQDEKRRLEIALRDAQKRHDELQRKLDAVMAIDRDMRNRTKTR